MEVIDEIQPSADIINNSQRAKNVVYAFYAIIVLSVIALYSNWLQLNLLEDFMADVFVPDAEVDSNDQRQMVIGLLQAGLLITTGILFIAWFYRAYRNVHVIFGEKKMKFSKSMAGWGFIIPIMSLYVPYQIAKEITEKQQNVLRRIVPGYKSIVSLTIVGVWWTAFIINNVIENIAFRSVFKTDTLDELLVSTKAYIVTDFIDIIAAIITIALVQQISKEESILFKNSYNLDLSTNSLVKSNIEE